jgi:hypothetical protein
MELRFKTWPYGTTKRVEVLSVEKAGRDKVVGCIDETDHGQGFILVLRAVSVAIGDHGTITFRQGGPIGGYWDFRRDRP